MTEEDKPKPIGGGGGSQFLEVECYRKLHYNYATQNPSTR